MAAEGQSATMVFDMEVQMKQICVTEFLSVEKMARINIHQCLLNVHGDQTVNVSTVRWCVSAVVTVIVDHLHWHRFLKACHAGCCSYENA